MGFRGRRPPTPSDQVLLPPVEPSQYTAIRYTERLAEAEAVASVGSKGDSYDKARAEAFNALFKAECIRNSVMKPKRGWRSVGDVETAVAEYVDWCNHRRLHGEIRLTPPAEFETNHWANQPAQPYDQAILVTAETRELSLYRTRGDSAAGVAVGGGPSGCAGSCPARQGQVRGDVGEAVPFPRIQSVVSSRIDEARRSVRRHPSRPPR